MLPFASTFLFLATFSTMHLSFHIFLQQPTISSSHLLNASNPLFVFISPTCCSLAPFSACLSSGHNCFTQFTRFPLIPLYPHLPLFCSSLFLPNFLFCFTSFFSLFLSSFISPFYFSYNHPLLAFKQSVSPHLTPFHLSLPLNRTPPLLSDLQIFYYSNISIRFNYGGFLFIYISLLYYKNQTGDCE